MGEVITVSFVLIPLTLKFTHTERSLFIANVYPRIFRLASVLSLTTILAGGVLSYLLTGWQDLTIFFASPRWLPITVGGILGLLLTMFHFFAESRLESRVIALAKSPDPVETETITRYLRIIPRAGLAILIAIFLLMMLGARGF